MQGAGRGFGNKIGTSEDLFISGNMKGDMDRDFTTTVLFSSNARKIWMDA